MSTGLKLLLAIGAVVVLAGIFLFTAAPRSDRKAATGLLARETVKRDRLGRRKKDTSVVAAPEPTGRAFESMALARREGGEVVAVAVAAPPDLIRPPMDADQLGQTRRMFLNRSIIGMFTLSLGGFGGAVLAFLWPTLSAGFGAKVKLGSLDDIKKEVESTKEPKYFPEARTYITVYPLDAGTLAKAKKTYSPGVYAGMEAGVAAVYQKCVHLGCKVPWCATSQWFECPCHGSQYNRVGERKGGPAPRGLDRFDVSVADGIITVDTSGVRIGPPDGTNTTGQEAEGPHCVGGGH
jgi:cytochrome b6-f complex iron-sulfur subunit